MAGFGFRLEARGYNRVRNNLRRTASQMPKIVEDVAYVWGQETRSALKSTPYPPKRPLQKYIRTGRLASSWAARRITGGVEIINTAKNPRYGYKYSGYVVGDAQGQHQAWMHKGRWWTARSKIDERAPKLTRALTKQLVKEMTR